MNTRGLNFFDKWMREHLPNAMTDDPVAVSDLADELMMAAAREGISGKEIDEEVDSVFEVIFEAMRHRQGNLPEGDQVALNIPAARLAREAGVSEQQASELIKRIGTDWESLLNETHFLKEMEGRLGQE